MLRWLERAAVAGALWWLVAGCAAGERPDGRLTVDCPAGERRLTVEQLRQQPQCTVR